jgi:hypothetical protein
VTKEHDRLPYQWERLEDPAYEKLPAAFDLAAMAKT